MSTIATARDRAPWLLTGPALLLFVGIVLITIAMTVLLGSTGVINVALVRLGLLAAPVQFMFSETGMVIALTHVLVPFVVISVWASLQRLDPQVESAALSLGASAFTVLRRIVLPQV